MCVFESVCVWSYILILKFAFIRFYLTWFLLFNRFYFLMLFIISQIFWSSWQTAACKQYFTLREHFHIWPQTKTYLCYSRTELKEIDPPPWYLNRLQLSWNSICKWPSTLTSYKKTGHWNDHLFTYYRKINICSACFCIRVQELSVIFSFQGGIIYVKMLLYLSAIKWQ